MKVFKEHLLEALETEPLGWGNWVRKPSTTGWDALVNDPGCRSCAIGSVFRKFTTMLIDDVQDQIDDIIGYDAIVSPEGVYGDEEDELILPQSWLEAISFVWESMKPSTYDNYQFDSSLFQRDILPSSVLKDIEQARWHMIDWVEANVPEDEVLWRIKA